MNIGLDYDDTFTKDPTLWLEFIKLADYSGHKVYCTTKREKELGTPGLQVPTVFCYRGNKLDAVARFGVHIDVWIDDDPSAVYRGDMDRMEVTRGDRQPIPQKERF